MVNQNKIKKGYDEIKYNKMKKNKLCNIRIKKNRIKYF